MAECPWHPPGTFSWAELATIDQQSSVAFYRALFDWDVNEQPAGPNETYSMFVMRGKAVAAACAMRPEERQGGTPPRWNLYVTVAAADECATRAEGLGGKVVTSPFDVINVGRIAILQDPTGGVFHVWETGKSIGATIVNEPGTLCWSELTTRDPKRAECFYTSLLGWTAKHGPPGFGMEYTEFGTQGHSGVGMLRMPSHVPADVPSYWMPYFQVADCDGIVARAAELGASVMTPPPAIPKGRVAILKDPQGAMFAVFRFVSLSSLVALRTAVATHRRMLRALDGRRQVADRIA